MRTIINVNDIIMINPVTCVQHMFGFTRPDFTAIANNWDKQGIDIVFRRSLCNDD